MGDPSIAQTSEGVSSVIAQKMEHNSDRFKNLPQQEKEIILNNYEKIREPPEASWLTKIGRAINILFFELPPFERAWIFFSLIVSVMVLLGKPEVRYVVWLLPIIAFFYAVDNRLNGLNSTFFDEPLFPTEQEIVQNYLREPLKTSIADQREQLLKGWHIYLVEKWAKAKPSEDQQVFDKQVEEGEYQFSLSRLDGLEKAKPIQERDFYLGKESIFNLFIYVVWNIFFACFVFFKFSESSKQKTI